MNRERLQQIVKMCVERAGPMESQQNLIRELVESLTFMEQQNETQPRDPVEVLVTDRFGNQFWISTSRANLGLDGCEAANSDLRALRNEQLGHHGDAE